MEKATVSYHPTEIGVRAIIAEISSLDFGASIFTSTHQLGKRDEVAKVLQTFKYSLCFTIPIVFLKVRELIFFWHGVVALCWLYLCGSSASLA
jgi:hypothetical protein